VYSGVTSAIASFAFRFLAKWAARLAKHNDRTGFYGCHYCFLGRIGMVELCGAHLTGHHTARMLHKCMCNLK